MNNKLNTFTLSGLIIGPILGSGVILLPPLLYNMVNNYALIIFAIILTLGFIFALIFSKLAVMFPGDAGVSLATKEALGRKYQLLTSLYLICAVFFGPVAVLLIAAKFVQPYFQSYSLVTLAFFIYVLTYACLLIKIDFLGKLMLLVSTLITLIFFFSSINILLNSSSFTFVLPSLSINTFGHSLVIVFWAIVGWEVIGNYSKEVKDKKTLLKAVIFSSIIVSLVYSLIILAICFGTFEFKLSKEFELIWLLEPIFKSYSNLLLVSVSLVLCIGTLILFVGGVSRLISSLKINIYTSKHLKNGTPIGALNFLSFIYMITLALVYYEYLSLANLVSFADGFFIANAIIGLITATVLFEKGLLKYSSIFLSLVFFIILLFSNIYILFTIFALFIYTYYNKNILSK